VEGLPANPDGGTWLRMQANYDLAQARKHESRIKVERYDSAHASA
jgi:plasmid maintenance system antidote protein VapI